MIGAKELLKELSARGMAQSILLIALPAAVGIAIVAGPLSEVMIGEDLREQARKIIPWIAAAGFFNGLLIHYFSEAFQLARKTAQRAILMLIPALANIGLNIVLLPSLLVESNPLEIGHIIVFDTRH